MQRPPRNRTGTHRRMSSEDGRKGPCAREATAVCQACPGRGAAGRSSDQRAQSARQDDVVATPDERAGANQESTITNAERRAAGSATTQGCDRQPATGDGDMFCGLEVCDGRPTFASRVRRNIVCIVVRSLFFSPCETLQQPVYRVTFCSPESTLGSFFGGHPSYPHITLF